MKILRVAAACLLAACALLTAFFGRGKIASGGLNQTAPEYKGIITLWHIDSFEGGVGSRRQFLLSASRGFEKENKGVLVMALDYTAESAETAMREGRFPDIISYGAGVNVKNLKPLFSEKSFAAGAYNGETYALPWCRGGYCMIENPEYAANKNSEIKLIVSQGETTNPLIAYALSGGRQENFEVLPPMNAYVKFVSGKVKYMIGTQRDVNRLITRGMDFTVRPLNGYNDLYQYVSVTSADETKTAYARRFVEYLLSEKVQKRLSEIGMCSCFYAVKYENPELRELQKADAETRLSAFTAREKIEELKAAGRLAATGNGEELIKIKKLLCLS